MAPHVRDCVLSHCIWCLTDDYNIPADCRHLRFLWFPDSLPSSHPHLPFSSNAQIHPDRRYSAPVFSRQDPGVAGGSPAVLHCLPRKSWIQNCRPDNGSAEPSALLPVPAHPFEIHPHLLTDAQAGKFLHIPPFPDVQ